MRANKVKLNPLKELVYDSVMIHGRQTREKKHLGTLDLEVMQREWKSGQRGS